MRANHEAHTAPPKRAQSSHRKFIRYWYDRLDEDQRQMITSAHNVNDRTRLGGLQLLVFILSTELEHLTGVIARHPDFQVSVSGRDFWTGAKVVQP